MEIRRIEPLLRKKPWRRLLDNDVMAPPMTNADYYIIPEDDYGLNYQYLSNEDLMKESIETAHAINSNLYSSRPVWDVIEKEVEYINDEGVVEKKTVMEEVIVGYDRVETVRTGDPEMILKQKASHLGRNGIEIADEDGSDREAFDTLCSYMDSAGITNMWVSLLYAAGKCGDAAAFIYRSGVGKDIEYEVFSPEEGNRFFPNKDEKGRDVLVRMYELNGMTAVDIHTTEEISTWVRGEIDEKNFDLPAAPALESPSGVKSWWQTVKGWFTGDRTLKKSEDGWTRVNRQVAQIDNATLQMVYLRFSDSFIGVAMQNINALDRALSYTSDKMRSTAFAKFMVKAFKIKDLPPLSSGEEVIGFEGDAETLKASDAKYVTPPDISNIAPINIKNIEDAIMKATMSVDLPPEILKSGADSSQTLKILLRREQQWCHIMWPEAYTAARHTVNVMKAMVDKVEKGGGRYTSLRVSIWNTPWIPLDEDALADRMTKLSYASILSQKNSRRELRLQYTDDEKQIAKEQEDKIYREEYTRLRAQADAKKDFGIDPSESSKGSSASPGSPSGDSAARKTAREGVDNNAPNR